MKLPRTKLVEWNELSNPDTASPILVDLAKAAKKGACYLYRRHPDALIPNPIDGALRRFWNNVCDDNSDDTGQDLPTSVVPDGRGKCAGVYGIDGWAEAMTIPCPGSNQSSALVRGNFAGTVTGPISSLAWETLSLSDCGKPNWMRLVCTSANGRKDTLGSISCAAHSSLPAPTFNPLNITRTDGGLDNCGSISPEWDKPPYDPTSPPTLPPYSSPPPNGKPGNDFSFAVPLIYAPITGNFNPRFDLGGVEINFRLDGIEFVFGDDITDALDGLKDYLPTLPEAQDYADDFDNLKDRIDDLEDLLKDDEIEIQVKVGECNNGEYSESNTTVSTTKSGKTNALLSQAIKNQNIKNNCKKDEDGGEPIEVTYLVGKCTKGEFSTENVTEEISSATASFYLRHKKELLELARESCKLEKLISELDNIVAIPESWGQRVGNDRPQLIVTYFHSRKVGGEDILSFWNLTIPFYNRTEAQTSKAQFPNYRRGNIQGTALLEDNSQIIANCSSVAEAKRVINALTRHTSKKAVTVKVTESRYEIDGVTVSPYKAKFYAKGQQNKDTKKRLIPTWEVKF